VALRLIYQMFSQLLSWIVLCARSATSKEIEILVLRHQLAVLQCTRRPTWTIEAEGASVLHQRATDLRRTLPVAQGPPKGRGSADDRSGERPAPGWRHGVGGRGEAGQGEVGKHAASEPTVGVVAGQEQRAPQSVGLRRAAGGEVLAGDEQDAQCFPVAAFGAVSRVAWTP
jgi:hypothetical protein